VGAVRVPPQTRASDVARDRGEAGSGARGEHTHSEVPIPRPVVQRASVRGQILDALRTALVAGELRPGEVYSAPALGERFGVSATPVREAMQQLALEGAVEVVPNRGFRVVERGARELAELAEVRALIEVPVVLRLARSVPVERWAELRPVAESTVRAASSGCPATYAGPIGRFTVQCCCCRGTSNWCRSPRTCTGGRSGRWWAGPPPGGGLT